MHVGLQDLGIHGQYDHPKVDEAMRRICDAARRNGKHVGAGALGARLDLLEKFGNYGVRFVMGGADFSILLSGASKSAAALQALNAKLNE